MRKGRFAVLGVLVAAVLATVAPRIVGAAAGSRLVFSAPYKLPTYDGGEPSLTTFAKAGRVYVIVSSPSLYPAFTNPVNNLLLPPRCSAGVAVWRSEDGGRTFDRGRCVGSTAGGADNDTTVAPDGTVYLADQEVVAGDVCKSTTLGRTWASTNGVTNCSEIGAALEPQGPDEDRIWLNAAPHGRLYLTYHDLAVNVPLMQVSTDGGRTFLPCGNILAPGSTATKNYSPVQGNRIGKPVVAPNGDIFVPIAAPNATAGGQHSVYSHIDVAIARGGCTGTTQFESSTVYEHPGADLGNLFATVTRDASGALYVVASGRLSDADAGYGVWLFVSRNGGRRWSKPIRVNAPHLTANALAAAVGGLGRGQIAVGWYGSSSSRELSLPNIWRYYVAISRDYGKHWKQATVTPAFHFGEICTHGPLCIPNVNASNRNLLDFSSIDRDPLTSCVIAAFPGDPNNTFATANNGNSTFSSKNYVVRQIGGRCLTKR